MADSSQLVPLDALVELRPEKTSGEKDSRRPYVGLEQIAQDSPRLLGWLPSSASVSTNSEFEADDILFGKLRPNLRKSVRAPFPGYCSTDILVLRPTEGHDPGFVGHVFQRKEVFIAATATAAGTKMPRTSWRDLRGYRVFCPDSQADQRRISAVLDTIDALIAKTEAVIAKLKQVRAGLLHDLLTRGLDLSACDAQAGANGSLRPPPDQAPHLYKESPLGRIPREWEARVCHSLCREIVVGIVVKPAQYYVQTGVPVLRSANVREEGITLTDLAFISRESNAALRKSMLRTGDIVTVRTGYPGTSAVVPPHLDGANCVDLVISRPNEQVVPEFLALWVNSSFGRDQVLRVQGGLAQQHFNVGEMRNLLVALPARPEQDRIVGRLVDADALREREKQVLAKLGLLKSGLMSDLLTGRVRTRHALEDAL